MPAEADGLQPKDEGDEQEAAARRAAHDDDDGAKDN